MRWGCLIYAVQAFPPLRVMEERPKQTNAVIVDFIDEI